MTRFTEGSGNLLDADVEALVNTVNTVGVMGKGIALQFKNAFPENFEAYEQACNDEVVQLGEMFVFESSRLGGPRWIINFPTKRHWRARSRLSHIDAGLEDLRRKIQEHHITSIAVPALGCGNGGLDWIDVADLIRRHLAGLDIDVHIYPPAGAPAAREMLVATERPELTPGKAALVEMASRYAAVALTLSLIETQKLMYFLQESGEDLQLRYTNHLYGPYADNLRHVLKALEGHHLSGFGDGSNPVEHAEPIVVLRGAGDEASHVLAANPSIGDRMNRVLELVEGYESPFGLELLASVHWAATRFDPDPSDESGHIAERVRGWNARKMRLFSAEHVTTAWERLQETGWLPRADAIA